MSKNKPDSLADTFHNWLISRNLLYKEQSILVACSGGSDSVALGLLLFLNGYRFSLAYMNFGLREAAYQEENFVQQLSQKWDTTAFIKRVPCQEYATQQKLSVQEAARELRYAWFEELIQQFHFDCLVTAHHLDDQIETVFASLLRSAEFSVLYGIPEKRTHIVRPLLNFCTKQDLQDFLALHNYTWCEDDSNLSDKYQRNFIRNNMVKSALSVNPGLHSFLRQKLELYSMQVALVDELLQQLAPRYEIAEPDGFKTLNMQSLAASESEVTTSLLAIWWLKKFKFTVRQIEEILALSKAQVGKKILLNQFEIWRERNGISVGTFMETTTFTGVELLKSSQINLKNRKINLDIVTATDSEKYVLRLWKPKDSVRLSPNAPKPTLVSDFLTNKAVPARQKKNCFVVENSSQEIVAIDELWKAKNSGLSIRSEWNVG